VARRVGRENPGADLRLDRTSADRPSPRAGVRAPGERGGGAVTRRASSSRSRRVSRVDAGPSLDLRPRVDPVDLAFVAAILVVLAMGALALGFVLKKAGGALAQAKDRQASAVGQVEEALALQREALALTRESIAAQRETNRLLGELVARMDGAKDGPGA
jgi:hypothetical protein